MHRTEKKFYGLKRGPIGILWTFVALALLFTPAVTWSDPLDNWTLHTTCPTPPCPAAYYAVAYGASTFVAVGFHGMIATSPDGAAWTVQSSITSNDLHAITRGSPTPHFVAVGDAGTNIYSTNGIGWGAQTTLLHNLKGVVQGSFPVPGFVVVGNDDLGNARIFTSSDGGAWGTALSLGNTWLNAVTYGNGIYSAVGAVWLTGAMPCAGSFMSTDGVHWTIREVGLPSSRGIGLNGVAYGNGYFVAVGDNGRIFTSTDGSIYLPKNSGVSMDLRGIAFGNDVFVAVGDGGTIITSTDLSTWTVRDSGIPNDLNGITFDGSSTFVAVAGEERILQSDPLPMTPNITSIDPNYGTIANNSRTFTLYGTGFVDGATVELTNFVLLTPPNQISIDATNVIVSPPTQITGTFNLTGAVIGQYDVVVTNPDGQSAILPKGFTVLDTLPPVTTAFPVGGTYNAPLSVTLLANEPATIYYYDPIESTYVEYSGPINISYNRDLQFYAIDAAGNTEATKTETYTIDTTYKGKVEPTTRTDMILPVTSTFTFPAEGTQTFVVDCHKVNHTLTDSSGNPLPPADYLKVYVIPDDVKTYSGDVSVTCDLAQLYPPESLQSGDYTLEVTYSNFFQPQDIPGINLFKGSISTDPITVTVPPGITTHIITTSVETAGGNIYLAGSAVSGPVVVKDGSEPTFTITPNPGYHIADVKVDDVSLGAISSYKFPPVDADHTISATFANVPAGTILVKAVKYTIGIGKRPVVTTSPVVGMTVRAFAKSAGSCAGQYGIISWPNYKDIWNSCPSVAQGVTNASGEAALSVPPGTYIVIGRYESNTSDPNDDIYVADNIWNIQANQTRSAHLYVITVANGKHLACKYSEHTGSSLFAIEPEYVEWSGTEELYPFVFDSMGDWNVSVSVAPPEGFVANQNTLSTDVNGDVKSVQFTITDIGSKWVSTGVDYEIKHKGKIKKIKSKIGIKLSKELAKKKGMSEYGHEEPKKSKMK